MYQNNFELTCSKFSLYPSRLNNFPKQLLFQSSNAMALQFDDYLNWGLIQTIEGQFSLDYSQWVGRQNLYSIAPVMSLLFYKVLIENWEMAASKEKLDNLICLVNFQWEKRDIRSFMVWKSTLLCNISWPGHLLEN